MNFAGGGTDIDVHQARASVEQGAILLDVREPIEWDAGHAPGALHLPMSQLAERVRELPSDRPIVCICHVGGRSAVVADALNRAGLDALNVAGGMAAWAAAGLPVVGADGGPGVVD